MERMVGSGNRELRRLKPGRNHDQGSEKGKGFLVPRQCVPSGPQPALLVWLLTLLAFKETSSFGDFGGPLLSWFPTSLSGSSFSTPSGALSSLSCPGFGPGLFSRPSFRGALHTSSRLGSPVRWITAFGRKTPGQMFNPESQEPALIPLPICHRVL